MVQKAGINFVAAIVVVAVVVVVAIMVVTFDPVSSNAEAFRDVSAAARLQRSALYGRGHGIAWQIALDEADNFRRFHFVPFSLQDEDGTVRNFRVYRQWANFRPPRRRPFFPE